jgi:hypothetical protein
MGKIKIIILSLLWLISSYSSFGSDSIRLKVRATYTKEIGTREATGKNDGKRVEEYLKSVNSSRGNPWCAAFVNWILTRFNIPTPKSAWSPSWFPTNKVVYKRGIKSYYVPQAGDVFGTTFLKEKESPM